MMSFISIKLLLFFFILRANCCSRDATKGKGDTPRFLFWPSSSEKPVKEQKPWVCEYMANVLQITGMETMASYLPFGGAEKMSWMCSEFFNFLSKPADDEMARSLATIMEDVQTRDGFLNLIFPFWGAAEESTTSVPNSSGLSENTEQNTPIDNNNEESSSQPGENLEKSSTPNDAKLNKEHSSSSAKPEKDGKTTAPAKPGLRTSSSTPSKGQIQGTSSPSLKMDEKNSASTVSNIPSSSEKPKDGGQMPPKPKRNKQISVSTAKVEPNGGTSSTTEANKEASSSTSKPDEGMSSSANPQPSEDAKSSKQGNKKVKRKDGRNKKKISIKSKSKNSSTSTKEVEAEEYSDSSRNIGEKGSRSSDKKTNTKRASRANVPNRKMQSSSRTIKNHTSHSRSFLDESETDPYSDVERLLKDNKSTSVESSKSTPKLRSGKPSAGVRSRVRRNASNNAKLAYNPVDQQNRADDLSNRKSLPFSWLFGGIASSVRRLAGISGDDSENTDPKQSNKPESVTKLPCVGDCLQNTLNKTEKNISRFDNKSSSNKVGSSSKKPKRDKNVNKSKSTTATSSLPITPLPVSRSSPYKKSSDIPNHRQFEKVTKPSDPCNVSGSYGSYSVASSRCSGLDSATNFNSIKSTEEISTTTDILGDITTPWVNNLQQGISHDPVISKPDGNNNILEGSSSSSDGKKTSSVPSGKKPLHGSTNTQVSSIPHDSSNPPNPENVTSLTNASTTNNKVCMAVELNSKQMTKLFPCGLLDNKLDGALESNMENSVGIVDKIKEASMGGIEKGESIDTSLNSPIILCYCLYYPCEYYTCQYFANSVSVLPNVTDSVGRALTSKKVPNRRKNTQGGENSSKFTQAANHRKFPSVQRRKYAQSRRNKPIPYARNADNSVANCLYKYRSKSNGNFPNGNNEQSQTGRFVQEAAFNVWNKDKYKPAQSRTNSEIVPKDRKQKAHLIPKPKDNTLRQRRYLPNNYINNLNTHHNLHPLLLYTHGTPISSALHSHHNSHNSHTNVRPSSIHTHAAPFASSSHTFPEFYSQGTPEGSYLPYLLSLSYPRHHRKSLSEPREYTPSLFKSSESFHEIDGTKITPKFNLLKSLIDSKNNYFPSNPSAAETKRYISSHNPQRSQSQYEMHFAASPTLDNDYSLLSEPRDLEDPQYNVPQSLTEMYFSTIPNVERFQKYPTNSNNPNVLSGYDPIKSAFERRMNISPNAVVGNSANYQVPPRTGMLPTDEYTVQQNIRRSIDSPKYTAEYTAKHHTNDLKQYYTKNDRGVSRPKHLVDFMMEPFQDDNSEYKTLLQPSDILPEYEIEMPLYEYSNSHSNNRFMKAEFDEDNKFEAGALSEYPTENYILKPNLDSTQINSRYQSAPLKTYSESSYLPVQRRMIYSESQFPGETFQELQPSTQVDVNYEHNIPFLQDESEVYESPYQFQRSLVNNPLDIYNSQLKLSNTSQFNSENRFAAFQPQTLSDISYNHYDSNPYYVQQSPTNKDSEFKNQVSNSDRDLSDYRVTDSSHSKQDISSPRKPIAHSPNTHRVYDPSSSSSDSNRRSHRHHRRSQTQLNGTSSTQAETQKQHKKRKHTRRVKYYQETSSTNSSM